MEQQPDVFTDPKLRHDLAGHLNAVSLCVAVLSRGLCEADAVEFLDDLIRSAEAAIAMLDGY